MQARRRTLRRLGIAAAVALVVGVAGVGASLWWLTSSKVDRQPIEEIADQGTEPAPSTEGARPTEFLVVGSDDRSGLTPEQQRELTTGGDTGAPRTDVILLVQVRPDDERTTIVSFPRDLAVEVDGTTQKINALMAAGGPNLLVSAVEDLTGIELDHYVEVSIPAFLTVVEAVGGVEVCLDAPLVDRKAGADLPAGCQELDARESLAFVRSRQGGRGDFARIARQQTFLAALADRAASARTFVDVPRLLRVVNRVSESITADEGLGVRQMATLAQELRGLADGELQTVTVPAFAQADTTELTLYEPGAEAIFSALRAGAEVPDMGSRTAREDADVLLWSGDAPGEAGHVESVLYFLGFAPRVGGRGPVAATRTVVYAGPDNAAVADWVAAVLGAPVAPLPPDVALADEVDAVVAVGAPVTAAAP